VPVKNMGLITPVRHSRHSQSFPFICPRTPAARCAEAGEPAAKAKNPVRSHSPFWECSVFVVSGSIFPNTIMGKSAGITPVAKQCAAASAASIAEAENASSTSISAVQTIAFNIVTFFRLSVDFMRKTCRQHAGKAGTFPQKATKGLGFCIYTLFRKTVLLYTCTDSLTITTA